MLNRTVFKALVIAVFTFVGFCILNYVPIIRRTKGFSQDVYEKIFFLETTNRTFLTLRQACAVESASSSNPSSQVIVYLHAPESKDSLQSLLRNKYNIVFRKLDFHSMFDGTALQDFHLRKDNINSPYRTVHLSDALRYVVVWKYGGIYLDLDVVVLKPLSSFRNALAKESDSRIANGMLFFDKYSNFLFQCLEELNRTYNGQDWGSNGPRLVQRVLQRYCKNSISNCSVRTLPKETMLPLHYTVWRDFFDRRKTDQVLKQINESCVVHFWNRFSANKIIRIGSDCAYERLAKRFCPVTYAFADNKGTF